MTTATYNRPEKEAIANPSHPGRLDWIHAYAGDGSRVLEIGCGTGWGVALPLLLSGIDVVGSDLDAESVARGQEIMSSYGIDGTAVLFERDAAEMYGEFDIVILSEVMEHLTNATRDQVLKVVAAKLAAGGTLLITTPNGYGWFELEQAIWTKLGFRSLVAKLRLGRKLTPLRKRVGGDGWTSSHPNTLSSSPHVQRFTLRGLVRTMEESGFEVVEARGSSFFAGPFTASLFSGVSWFGRMNQRLGVAFPRVAADFYVAARVKNRP